MVVWNVGEYVVVETVNTVKRHVELCGMIMPLLDTLRNRIKRLQMTDNRVCAGSLWRYHRY